MITKNHRSIRKIFVQKNDEKKRSKKVAIQTRATNKNAKILRNREKISNF